MPKSDQKNIIKSIVIDGEVEEVDTECTIGSSMRLQKTEENDGDHAQTFIRFPNGITLELPNDFYFFYETLTLRDASPRFVASVSVVLTYDKSISWKEIIKYNIGVMMEQNNSFFKMFDITQNMLLYTFERVVVTIVEKFEREYSELPLMWDKRMSILNFFKVFKAYLSELKTVILRNINNSPEIVKELIDSYKSKIEQTLNNFVLLSLIWSFSGILDIKNKKKFEDVAKSCDVGHKLNLITQSNSDKLSLFDLVFNYEKMHWMTVADLKEYGVPIKVDRENLIVMTDDYLKYSNFISFLLKNSSNADFG